MKRINLISSASWKGQRFWKTRLTIIVALFIFSFIARSFWQVSAVSRYKEKVSKGEKVFAEMQSRAVALENEIEQIQKERNEKNKDTICLQNRLFFLKQVKENGVKWAPILTELGKIIPQQVWMKKISLTDMLITLKGSGFNNNAISEFMVALEDNSYFQNTSFNYTQKAKGDSKIINFELTTSLEMR